MSGSETDFQCKNDCAFCDCWDPDREGCTMSSIDRGYACSLECDDNQT